MGYYKHGMSQPDGDGKVCPEYRAYINARRRCNSTAYQGYERYGGRGIQFKFTSFEQFYSEVGPRPTALHSIDRIDGDGHYEPGNVRWATATQQSRNSPATKLNEVIVEKIRELHKQELTNDELAVQFGVSSSLISCIVTGKLWKDVAGEIRKPKSGNPKLTKEDIHTIRASNLSAKYLAQVYGVTSFQIYNIRSRRSWKEI